MHIHFVLIKCTESYGREIKVSGNTKYLCSKSNPNPLVQGDIDGKLNWCGLIRT